MRDLLGAQAVLLDLDPADKKALLQTLACHAAQGLGLKEHEVFDALWEREKLGTTGVGGGIAIPHGRIASLDRVCGFFARLKNPIEFEAVDGRPVDLVFLLLAPLDAGADHLHALATVSRAMRETSLCDKLRHADNARAVEKLLCEAPSAQAA